MWRGVCNRNDYNDVRNRTKSFIDDTIGDNWTEEAFKGNPLVLADVDENPICFRTNISERLIPFVPLLVCVREWIFNIF